MSVELNAAINGLYVAFSDVPKPEMIEGCPCCLDEDEIHILLRTPLRELKPAELSSYASTVFLTLGDVPDFLYFLPRILEILASESGWWPDPEVVGRALHSSGFERWPAIRRQEVIHYFHAVIADRLENRETHWEIDSWVCALGRFLPDISAFLQQIETTPEGVVEFYKANAETLEANGLSNAFWERESPAYSQVVAWFKSDPVEVIKAERWREIES